jgi:hypothetical protein
MATPWRQRYGHYLTAQRYDDQEHAWHDAKDKNWGPWDCCGGAAKSPPCTPRPRVCESPAERMVSSSAERGVGSTVRFLNNESNCVLVVAENQKNWILDCGRIAKKKTEGVAWMWLDDWEKLKGE